MKHLRIIASVIGVPILLALAACGGGGGGGDSSGGSAADTTPPAVTATNPPNAAVGAGLTLPVTATFSEPLDPATVGIGDTFTLRGPNNALVNGTVTLNVNGDTASFTPSAPLAFDTDYAARVTTAIKDTAGNPLASDVAWRFNTGKKIAAGHSHTCARLENDALKCWGRNDTFQLGLGASVTDNRGDDPGEMGSLPPVNVGAGRAAVAIAAGNAHTCVRLDSGEVKCWGQNSSGQLGFGHPQNRGNDGDLPAVDLGTGRAAVEIAAGSEHTCARLDNGTVKCWGRNNSGQLGLGDVNSRGDQVNEMGDSLPAVDVGTGLGGTALTAVAIAAGSGHTCVLLQNGQVGIGKDLLKCWGNNASGQLGLGDKDNRGDGLNAMGQTEMGNNLPAVNLGAGRSAVAIAVGSDHTCARLDNGAVKCWGANASGQLGLGDPDDRGNAANEMGDLLPPVNLGTGRTAVEIVGRFFQTCARLDSGQVKCWGDNFSGQLGLGDNVGDRAKAGDQANEMGDLLPPVILGTGRTAVEIAPGNSHTCARLDDGAVKCWGFNASGQLGLGHKFTLGDDPDEMGDNLPPVDL